MIRVETTAGILSEIFRPINAISDSCRIQFDQDGIVIPGAGPLNLAVVDIVVDKNAFKTYRTDGPVLGIKLGKIIDIINMASPSDKATLTLDDERNMLELELGHKEFVLGLVQLDSVPSQPDIPDTSYPVRFEIPQTVLSDTIDTASIFSDKITFEAMDESKHVVAKAEGDIDKTKVRLIHGNDIKSVKTAPIENSFGLGLLDDIVPVIPNKEDVEVKLAHDRPMILSYSSVDDFMDVSYTIAPWKQAD